MGRTDVCLVGPIKGLVGWTSDRSVNRLLASDLNCMPMLSKGYCATKKTENICFLLQIAITQTDLPYHIESFLDRLKCFKAAVGFTVNLNQNKQTNLSDSRLTNTVSVKENNRQMKLSCLLSKKFYT